MAEPEVPEGTPPAEVGAPVVRSEQTGEQQYPEQFSDNGPAKEKAAE
ncbi:hypothetical protein K6U06_01550 [Acidiferrimicrobium sp. IK]|nr:hypothetical protein [Acidiferrimicrobium sp. IK]MCU4183029.1 hypothetical protein [Acidiferrimicrobium sp. IK]